MTWSRTQRSVQVTSSVVAVHAERHGGADVGDVASSGCGASATTAAARRRSGWPSTAPLSSDVTTAGWDPSGRSLPSTPCTSRSSTVHDGHAVDVEDLPVEQVQPGVEHAPGRVLVGSDGS